MDDQIDHLYWEVPEFVYKEKNSDWYWILGIVVVVGILISIFLENLIFAIFLGVGGFVVSLFASKHPDLLHVEINKKGIHIDDERHTYSTIESFWVEDRQPGRERIIMRPKNTLSLQVVVPIAEDVDPDVVHDYLTQYLREEEQTETLAERIMEFFHF